MTRNHRLRMIVFVAAAIGSSTFGQGFSFPDFSSTTGLALNGSAVQSGVNLQITGNLTNQAGTAWYTTPQSISGGFDTVFTFRITSNGTAADGMTFAIQNDSAGSTALGAAGGALGYQGLSTLFNSVVVEFDTFPNGDFGETVGNVISVHTNGTGPTGSHEAQAIGSFVLPGILATGAARQARIEYVSATATLNIYLDNLTTPVLTIPYSFTFGGTFAVSGSPVAPPILANGSAIVGFTGGTGGLTQANVIESWTFASSPPTSFTLAITQPQGAGSLNVQVANGPAGQAYLTAITIDPLNATSPGLGWWGGLHISILDLFAIVAFGQPPFVGTLNGLGNAGFSLTSGLGGPFPTAYAVTRTLGPGFSTITATSNIVTVTLL